MRIGIDYRLPASSSQRGSARTFREIVNALAQYDCENEYILYVNSNPFGDTLITLARNFKFSLLKKTNYIIDEQCVFPKLATRDALDILWCPYNTFPLFLTKKCKLLVTIHDLIFLFPPEGKQSIRQRIGRLYRKWCILIGKKRIDACITVSEYSAGHIRERLGIDAICIPTYNLINDFYKKAQPVITLENQREDFYFTVSGDAPSKNLFFLLKIFNTDLREDRLIIAGVKRDSYLRRKNTSPNIIFLDEGIPDTNLIQYYRTCKAFIFPSLQEGFGIPIIEALVCGAPVIASNRTSIPGVLNGFGCLFDPTSKDDFLSALNKSEQVIFDNDALQSYLKAFIEPKNTALKLLDVFSKTKEQVTK